MLTPEVHEDKPHCGAAYTEGNIRNLILDHAGTGDAVEHRGHAHHTHQGADGHETELHAAKGAKELRWGIQHGKAVEDDHVELHPDHHDDLRQDLHGHAP